MELNPWRNTIFITKSGDSTPARGNLSEFSVRHVQGEFGHSLSTCLVLGMMGKKDKTPALNLLAMLGGLERLIKCLHGMEFRSKGGRLLRLHVSLGGDMMYHIGMFHGPSPRSPGKCCLWCLVLKHFQASYCIPGIEVRPYLFSVLKSVTMDRVVPDKMHGFCTTSMHISLSMKEEIGMSPFAQEITEVLQDLPQAVMILFTKDTNERLRMEEKQQLIGPLETVLWENKWRRVCSLADKAIINRIGGEYTYYPYPGAMLASTNTMHRSGQGLEEGGNHC